MGPSFGMLVHAMFAFVHGAFPLLRRFRAADDTRTRGRLDDGQLARGVVVHFGSLRQLCYGYCNITHKKDQDLY